MAAASNIVKLFTDRFPQFEKTWDPAAMQRMIDILERARIKIPNLASTGATLLFSAGVPGAGLGADGDFVIDYTDHTFYGPKTGGAWGSGTSLIGPAGTGSRAFAYMRP